jgi:lysine-N-methylase
MSMPVRSLPVAQNWDCSGCAACCRSYHVPVTPAEQERINAQGWEADPELKGVAYFARDKGGDRLNHRPDGACVFLGPDDRCRIHAKFGSAAKPLACRIYPFALVPAGDHWRVGIRFACPAAAANEGRPLADHLPEVREYAALLEADSGKAAAGAPPVPLQPGQVVPWADLLRITGTVSNLLAENGEPLERRWRTVLELVATLRKAHFDGGGDPKKAVTGHRLGEMLHVLAGAMAEEVSATAAEVPPPSWVGRSVFRPVLALYVRKDHGAEKGTAQTGPVSRFLAALRFARGKGVVPRVNALIPEGMQFDAAERPLGPDPAADALLTRYYRVKAESMQFCGPSNFNLAYWDGLEALALTYPAVMWLARVLAAGGTHRADAVRAALRIVDDNFGFNKLLGRSKQRSAVQMLASRGELPKLVAWYGR